MLTDTREATLHEIDEQIRTIHQDLRHALNPMQRLKIERLESERDWILGHTPGLKQHIASCVVTAPR